MLSQIAEDFKSTKCAIQLLDIRCKFKRHVVIVLLILRMLLSLNVVVSLSALLNHRAVNKGQLHFFITEGAGERPFLRRIFYYRDIYISK